MSRFIKKFCFLFLTLFTFLLIGCRIGTLEANVEKISIKEDSVFQIEINQKVDEVSFTSIDESIALVTKYGLVTGVHEGKTSILIEYKQRKISISVEVLRNIPSKEDKGLFQVYFIDVGQADAILLDLPNGEWMMIDAGYGYSDKSSATRNLFTTLDALKVDVIDHFLITHNHQDHYGFVPEILKRYQVNYFYGSGSVRSNSQYLEIMTSIERAGLEYYIVEVGDLIVAEEYFKIQVVATQRLLKDDDPNISSVMVRIVYKNVAFMFTGDGGYKNNDDAELIALRSGLELQADVLKVGHHGSRYSSGNKFLEAVKPKYAILTTKENSQDNLPTSDALNRLKKIGASIYQTKDHGNITVRTDGLTIEIETER